MGRKNRVEGSAALCALAKRDVLEEGLRTRRGATIDDLPGSSARQVGAVKSFGTCVWGRALLEKKLRSVVLLRPAMWAV